MYIYFTCTTRKIEIAWVWAKTWHVVCYHVLRYFLSRTLHSPLKLAQNLSHHCKGYFVGKGPPVRQVCYLTPGTQGNFDASYPTPEGKYVIYSNVNPRGVNQTFIFRGTKGNTNPAGNLESSSYVSQHQNDDIFFSLTLNWPYGSCLKDVRRLFHKDVTSL